MDLARPYAALTDGLEGEVLGVLTGTTRPMSGRQIHRLARRGSDRGIQFALNRLVEQGLVDAEAAPPAILYTFNREHIAAPVALALAELRATLLQRLRDAFAQWDVPPAHAALFGSAARADGDTTSDIDLLIIRPRAVGEDDAHWREQVEGLAEAVRRWTGNRAGISEISEDDLPRLAEERPPIFDELRRDAIALAGADFNQLVE